MCLVTKRHLSVPLSLLLSAFSLVFLSLPPSYLLFPLSNYRIDLKYFSFFVITELNLVSMPDPENTKQSFVSVVIHPLPVLWNSVLGSKDHFGAVVSASGSLRC